MPGIPANLFAGSSPKCVLFMDRFRSARGGLVRDRPTGAGSNKVSVPPGWDTPLLWRFEMIDLSEKLYTVKEVAYLLRCSYDTARRDFLSEEGVLERSNSGVRKRLYRQILIPESVLLRVLRRREIRPTTARSAA